MIGHRVLQEVEPEQAHLRKHPALVGDPGGQNIVERRDAVSSHDQEAFGMLRIFINVADFSAAAEFKSGYVGFEYRCLQVHVSFGKHFQLY